jgi:hypothetical protein
VQIIVTQNDLQPCVVQPATSDLMLQNSELGNINGPWMHKYCYCWFLASNQL